MTIAHRPMDDRDEHFVIDSWAKSFRESDHAGLIQNADWFSIMIPQIEKVIRLPSVRVTIAADPSDDDRRADIYGWLCSEPMHDGPLVYYVFVKSAYRARGIARGLFAAAGIALDQPFAYACKTYIVDDLARRHALAKIAPYARYAPMAGRH